MGERRGQSIGEAISTLGSRTELPRDFDRAAQEVLEFLARRIGFLNWLVLRIENGKRIVVHATTAFTSVRVGEELRLPTQLDLASVHGEQACFIADATRVLDDDHQEKLAFGPVRSFLEVPIHFDDGRSYGSLCAMDPMPQPPELQREMSLIRVFASVIGWLIEMEESAQELAREVEQSSTLALTDELTHLPNRRAWNHMIEQEEERAKRLGTSPQILFIDVDDLKTVNDSVGHGAGDELLFRTGQTILKACRKRDFVARIGGDEFGVLLVCGTDSGEAVRERIRTSLASQGIRCSIGFGVRRPPMGLEDAIREADAALYEEKRAKKGLSDTAVIEVFEPTQLFGDNLKDNPNHGRSE